MINVYLIIRFEQLFRIIDKLNTCGRCLNIKESRFLSEIINLLNNSKLSQETLESYVELMINILEIEDILDNDQCFTEMLRSSIYSIFIDLIDSLNNIGFDVNKTSVSFSRRIGINDAILRITSHGQKIFRSTT